MRFVMVALSLLDDESPQRLCLPASSFLWVSVNHVALVAKSQIWFAIVPEGMAKPDSERAGVALLDDVTAAAERVRQAEAAERRKVDAARERLRQRIRVAHDEGIPFAVIARAAGLSRERVRQLYAGD
jgi:K+-sensing histidine kinase KdpD